ncbi:glycine receptor subunit alpha-2-like [Toxorhynchites rutilus septentrionalis]|uniref:glycine receptor subunit alpha-2-like n=1 Tax=Toxorhynchites rutilus septentrionalis TaxID=329112 RepID=UPI00247A6EA5|nr:glycine receptor subunit alpha-2-like [Toxorhynchites rutilus septentrionalis]
MTGRWILLLIPMLINIQQTFGAKNSRNNYANYSDSSELSKHPAASLSLTDILPTHQKTYDKNRAPKLLGQPTVVYFHVTVLSIDSINEESMTYVADIFLAQSWRDPRLRLPENMSEEYRILDVDWLHSIWRPDCFFKNAKKVTFHEMSIPNHYLWLYHDKTLLYMSKLTLVLSCAMKFESYPHDTQICSMMIESYCSVNIIAMIRTVTSLNLRVQNLCCSENFMQSYVQHYININANFNVS